MAVPNKIRDSAREADAALAEIAAANETPAPAPDAPTPNPNEITDGQSRNVVETPTPPVRDESDLARKLSEAEQRYATLQGMFNKQSNDLSELKGRTELLSQLIAQRAEAGTATPAADEKPASLISTKEREEFGEDLLDVARRVAREDWKPHFDKMRRDLDEVMNKMQQMVPQIETSVQSAHASAQDRFKARLTQLAPKWEKQNTDQKFLDWLNQNDVFSGYQRMQLLHAAYQQHDADRVAQFFNTFFNEQPSNEAPSGANEQRVSSVDPATLIAPSNSSSGAPSSNPSTGKQWTMREIEKIYDDKSKGRITAGEFAKREAEITKALSEGRIKPD